MSRYNWIQPGCTKQFQLIFFSFLTVGYIIIIFWGIGQILLKIFYVD